MTKTFLASDHHLGHSNILTFKDKEGNLIRPGFSSIEEHDEYIVAQHNKVVSPEDRVYFLGDFTFHNRNLQYLDRMNGRKVLIKGNHDTLKLSQYVKYFDDIRACHPLGTAILTHIPIHIDQLSRWSVNIHGHLHQNTVQTAFGTKADGRYFSVCMEKLDDYTPITLDDIKKKLA